MKRLLLLSSLIITMTMNSACNDAKEELSTNPLLEEWNTEFGVPPFDQIKAHHFEPAFEEAMKLHNEEIEAIVNSTEDPTFENVILAYDNSGIRLYGINLLFGMLSSSDLTDDMKVVQESVMPRVDEHYNTILLNDALFERIKAVYDMRHRLALDELQMRLTEKTYNKFVRAGALLDEADKARLKEINSELSKLTIRFGNNLLAENANYQLELNAMQVTELPEGVRNQAQEAAKSAGKHGYVFTLDKSSMLPFLTYSSDRELRREIYDAYLNRCNNNDEYDNKQTVEDVTKLRIEKAQLLGFDSYAHYVIADQMAGTPEAAYELLEEIWEPALESAKMELETMEELFHQDYPDGEFERSDWWYYAEKVRKQKYQLDEAVVSQYLSFENVRQGMFGLANRLYKIDFYPLTSVSSYHEECSVWKVVDSDNSVLGVLYIDPYPRSTKGGGAWCGYFTEQRYEEGKRIAPVVGIVCNFTPPVGSTPSLLTRDEAETLFHEFGHALHFLFADVRYRGLAEVEGDFVELPSQIMENWAFEPEILRSYATHYRTKEVIPDALIKKMQNAALFNQGFITTELAAAALIDLDIHALEHFSDMDVEAFEEYNLATRRGLIEQIAPRYRYPYFAHIFNGGYSAGYYFYLWAEVLDKDAFEAFRQSHDLCDAELAHSFRYDLLAQGGQKPGMEMYRRFRGADPDKTPMLRARGLWHEPEPVADTLDEEMVDISKLGTGLERPIPGLPVRPKINPSDVKRISEKQTADANPVTVNEN